MNIYKAVDIFNDIENETYEYEDKLEAINEVLGLETYNSIKKDKILDVFRWVWKKFMKKGYRWRNESCN